MGHLEGAKLKEALPEGRPTEEHLTTAEVTGAVLVGGTAVSAAVAWDSEKKGLNLIYKT